MADPLSTIACVLGIFGAAIQTSATLFDIVQTIVNTPKEIDSFLKDVIEFEGVLSNIYIALQGRETQEALRKDAELLRVVSNMIGPVNGCREMIDHLRAKIERRVKPTTAESGKCKISGRSIMWYLEKANVRQSFIRFHSHKTNVDAGLMSILLLCNLRSTSREFSLEAHQEGRSSLPETSAGDALKEYAESVSTGRLESRGQSEGNDSIELSQQDQQIWPFAEKQVQSKETIDSIGTRVPVERIEGLRSPAGLHILKDSDRETIDSEHSREVGEKIAVLYEALDWSVNQTFLFKWVAEAAIRGSKVVHFVVLWHQRNPYRTR